MNTRCGLEIWAYCIDWSSTGAMLGGLGAIATAVIVFYTARKWIRQETFKFNRETAIKVVQSAEFVRRVAMHFRQPLTPPERMLIDLKIAGAFGEEASQLEHDALWEILGKRRSRIDGSYAQISEALNSSRIIFSNEINDKQLEALSLLDTIVNNVHTEFTGDSGPWNIKSFNSKFEQNKFVSDSMLRQAQKIYDGLAKDLDHYVRKEKNRNPTRQRINEYFARFRKPRN